MGVFFAAAVGCVLGESSTLSPLLPGLPAVVCLLLAIPRGNTVAFWAGVVFFFATLQAGQRDWNAGLLLSQTLQNRNPVITARGVVEGMPQRSGNFWRFPLRVERIETSEGISQTLFARVSVRWPGAAPNYGDVVELRGRLQAVPSPRNPGQFDYSYWLRLRGTPVELRAWSEAEAQIMAHGRGNPLIAMALKTRARIASLLGEGITAFPEIRALLLAMTLGTTEQVSAERLEEFRRTGTLHLFSVSGLHVGMLGVLLWMALKPLRLPFPVHVLSIIALLFFYATVTGLKPASVRAAFMASVVLGGLLLFRPPAALNSLAAAGVMLLVADSAQLFNPGFQLSFSVVAAILVVGVPLARWLQLRCGPDDFLPVQLYGWKEKCHSWLTKELGGLAAVSFSAWLGSLPLIAANYHIISLSALFVNLLAVPLAFIILAIAMLALITGSLAPVLAAIFNHTNVLVCGLLLQVIHLGSQVPGSVWNVGRPVARNDLLAVFFDFGEGESAAFASGKSVWLVDTGSAWDWQQTLALWLAQRGVSRLDGLFLTHGDARHVGGAGDAVENFAPRFIAVSPPPGRSPTLRRLFSSMEAQGLPRRLVFSGMRWQLDENWFVEIFYPPMGLKLDRADDRVMVTRWTYRGGLRILVAGDASALAQEWLIKHAASFLASEVLVLGRPETGEAPSAEFLRAVAPSAIIVASQGYHRSEEQAAIWDEALAATGAEIFRKEQTGAVLLEKIGDGLQLRPFLPSQPPFVLPPAFSYY